MLINLFFQYKKFFLLTCLSFANITVYAQQNPSAYMSATRYNSAGQISGTISPDPDGSGSLLYLATRNTYDSRGRLIKVERGNLNTWANENVPPKDWNFTVLSSVVYTYDVNGRQHTSQHRDKNGNGISLVQSSYDWLDRVTCKAQRMNPSTYQNLPSSACTLDDSGSYGRDRITHYEYNDYNDVKIEWRAWGTDLKQKYVERTFKYASRLVETMKDANGYMTKLEYDNYGRAIKRIYPSKSAAGQLNNSDYNEYKFDRRGNMRWERKRNGANFNYYYDKNSRLTRKDASGTANDIYYKYDLRGLTLHSRFTSHSGQGIINTFDSFGRLSETTSTMGGANRKLRYSYDNNSNRTRLYHSDNQYFSYRFDQLDRMTGVGESSSSANVLTINYHNNGKRQNILRYSGAATTNYYYDNAQRFYRFNQNFSGSSNDLTNTFQFNPAGQITQLTHSNDMYHYFGNDNHTGSYTSNGLNQYTHIGGKSLSYDANGNLKNYDGNNYYYDNENRLTGINGKHSATFKYDPLGRLYQVTINGVTRYFLYDGDALVAEYTNSTTNYPTRRYLHGDQVDEALAQYNGSSIGADYRQYLHSDHRGSIIAHSNRYSSTIKTIAYDTFGIPENNNLERFGYTGQIWLGDIGLYYYKARMYSPYLGRFLQTDPIFYADQMNMYTYVGNDPINMTDPSGKQGCYAMASGNGQVCAGAGAIAAAKSSGNSLSTQNKNNSTPSNLSNSNNVNQRKCSGQMCRAAENRGNDTVAGASEDFINNYKGMREANTIGADKYFHCKANCEATQRGDVGEDTAETLSNIREWSDEYLKGDPASASELDQQANKWGREQGRKFPQKDCKGLCQKFRPKGLKSRY